MQLINIRTFYKPLLTAFFAVAILFLSGSAAHAQHGYRLEKPLTFAAGKSIKTVKGRIANTLEAHEYKFKARQGQTLRVVLTSPNKEMIFMVMNAEDELVDGFTNGGERNQSGELPADGEYKINVSADRGKGSYTLVVEIE